MICDSSQPIDAPKRPGEWRILSSTATPALLFSFLVLLSQLHQLILLGMGSIGIAVSLLLGVREWRRCERKGWYEKREIEVPALPFASQKEKHIIFEADAVLSKGWTERNKISYSQIACVQVDYDERRMTLGGLRIYAEGKNYHRVGERHLPNR